MDKTMRHGNLSGQIKTDIQGVGYYSPSPRTWDHRYPTPAKDMGPGTRKEPSTRDILPPWRMTDTGENVTFPKLR